MTMTTEEEISQFCQVTGASPMLATQYLEAAQGNLEAAITGFYADFDEPSTEAGARQVASTTTSSSQPPVNPNYTGPRTLDGRPAPDYAPASSSAAKKPKKRTGLGTLSSLSSGGGHGNDHDHDDDSEDNDHGRGDLFAGGEKSGLAVQDPTQVSRDPKKLVDEIVAKARENARRGDTGPAPSPQNRFQGTGQTLGGDDVESRVIPDPHGPARSGSRKPVAERILHLWTNGFSIDDGELHSFDNPNNERILELIRTGRAPLSIMNVRPDQEVSLSLQQHPDAYTPQPRIYRPFGGEGRRLGADVPGDGSAAAAATPQQPASRTTPSGGMAVPSTGVDESQPVLLLRIQLPDGFRVAARFNPTQTLGDVYEFVARTPALAGAGPRLWVLATTFPNKEHIDRSQALGEVPEFKRGGTAVVKWL